MATTQNEALYIHFDQTYRGPVFGNRGRWQLTNALNRSQARWDANTWAASLRS